MHLLLFRNAISVRRLKQNQYKANNQFPQGLEVQETETLFNATLGTFASEV